MEKLKFLLTELKVTNGDCEVYSLYSRRECHLAGASSSASKNVKVLQPFSVNIKLEVSIYL